MKKKKYLYIIYLIKFYRRSIIEIIKYFGLLYMNGDKIYTQILIKLKHFVLKHIHLQLIENVSVKQENKLIWIEKKILNVLFINAHSS